MKRPINSTLKNTENLGVDKAKGAPKENQTVTPWTLENRRLDPCQ